MFSVTYSRIPVDFSELMAGSRTEQSDIDEDKFSGYIHVKIGVEREPIIQTGEWMLDSVTKPAAAGSFPSTHPLVFWPRVGAFGTRAVLVLWAQLSW